MPQSIYPNPNSTHFILTQLKKSTFNSTVNLNLRQTKWQYSTDCRLDQVSLSNCYSSEKKKKKKMIFCMTRSRGGWEGGGHICLK